MKKARNFVDFQEKEAYNKSVRRENPPLRPMMQADFAAREQKGIVFYESTAQKHYHP